MVEGYQDAGKSVGTPGCGKSPRGRTDKRWDRACSDAASRTEVHSRKPSDNQAFVYLMRDAEGAVKVGCTGSVQHRIASMHNMVPFSRRPIRLIRAIKIDRPLAFKVEKIVHWLLERHALGREWFRVTPSVAGRTLNRAVALALEADGTGKRISRGWLRRSFGSPHGR